MGILDIATAHRDNKKIIGILFKKRHKSHLNQTQISCLSFPLKI